MSLLFETIRIESGIPMYLSWHEARMAVARKEIWGIEASIKLEDILDVPAECSKGLVRCNIYYDQEIQDISFKTYHKKPIRSLKLVRYDPVDYHVKYSDRSVLQSLLEQRGECDEIIIVKHGLITDTSMSNLVFFDGNKWITPARPLLNGTTRQRLLSEGKIFTGEIKPEDLPRFPGVKLINVMRYLEEEEMVTEILR
jgi:4-amino-4-deoxychorismate lyase